MKTSSILLVLTISLHAAAPTGSGKLTQNMEFVRGFSPGADPAPFEKALKLIGRLAQKESQRLTAMRFFRELLGSGRYRALHYRLWLEMSRFYTGSRRETLLLRALRRSPSDRSRAIVYAELAGYYDTQNSPGVRQVYLQRLVDLADKERNIPGVGAAYRDLGMMDLKKLDAFSALRHFMLALDFAPEPAVAGDACLGTAVALGMMNKPNLQETYFRRALDNAQKWSLKALKIRTLSRYGQTLLENGNLDEALRIVNLSISEEKVLKKYVCLRDSLFRRSLIYEKLGRRPAMVRSLVEAVDSALRNRDYDGFFPVIAYLADTQVSRGELKEARKLLQIIDDLFAPYHQHYFLSHYLEGRLGQAENDITRAESGYLLAVRALRKNLPSFTFSFRSFWRHWLDSLYSRMIRFRLTRFTKTGDSAALDSAIRLHEEKNEMLARCIVYRGSRDLSLQREETRLENKFNRYLEKRQSGGNDAYLEAKLLDLRRQFQEIRELQMAVPQASIDLEAPLLNPGQLRKSLDPDQLVVKFMLLQNQVAVVTLGRRCFRFRYLSQDRHDLIDNLLRLVDPLNDFSRGQVDYLRVHFDLPLAHLLYKQLINPIKADLEGIQELIVIPEKELFQLPFDALVTGFIPDLSASNAFFSEYSVAEYLVQRFRVSLAFSMTHLNRRFRPLVSAATDLVAFSGPIVSSPEERELASSGSPVIRNLSTLPATLREARRISAYFRPDRVRLFLGEDFTIPNFRRHAPRSRIVHVATHYIANLDSPWHSGLLFSPEEKKRREGSVLLRANNVQHIPMQAELMVLSACESAEQRVLGIQGMTGMTAALSENGVRSALVSMWPVDEYSSGILPVFYKHFQRHERSSRALRRAKLEFMHTEVRLADGKYVTFSHPFFWGNFQLLRFRR